MPVGLLQSALVSTFVSGGQQRCAGSTKGKARQSRSETANVDGRRRLVLVRRDDVEHLTMTGGPVDVVIETNIENKATPAFDAKGSGRLERDKVEPIDKKAPTLVSRPSRTLSKTADEA